MARRICWKPGKRLAAARARNSTSPHAFLPIAASCLVDFLYVRWSNLPRVMSFFWSAHFILRKRKRWAISFQKRISAAADRKKKLYILMKNAKNSGGSNTKNDKVIKRLPADCMRDFPQPHIGKAPPRQSTTLRLP